MRKFGKLVMAFGVVALSATATPAFAQGRGGFGMFGGGGAMLLTNKGVQEELKVNEEQAGKLQTLAEEMGNKRREVFESLQNSSQEERREKMTEFARTSQQELQKSLKDILKPEQVTRFQQIELQASGHTAFMMPRVQEKLKLTAEQKEKIQGISEEIGQSMREAFQSFQDDREGAMKKMQEIRKDAVSKVTAVLTDEQKSTWKELTGTPYEVKFEPRRPN